MMNVDPHTPLIILSGDEFQHEHDFQIYDRRCFRVGHWGNGEVKVVILLKWNQMGISNRVTGSLKSTPSVQVQVECRALGKLRYFLQDLYKA